MKHLFEYNDFREDQYKNIKSSPQLKYQLLEMDKKKFNDIYTKFKWHTINRTKEDIKNNLFTLVNVAYDDIGGHVRINSPEKVSQDKDLNFWTAIDINNDPYADVVIFGKKTKYGVKISGIGHNDEKCSKSELFKKLVSILKTKGFFIEASDKVANILLSKGTPFIKDIRIMREIFNSSDAHFTDNQHNWYIRTVNSEGEKSQEILFGKPNV